MKKKLFVALLCISLILSFSACGGGGGSTDAQPEEGTGSGDEFLIGIIQPLTGSNGYVGTEVKAAQEIAQDEQKTLLGRPLKLVFADAPDDTTATSEVERLMSVQGVKYFVGAYGFSSIPIQAAVMKNDGFMFETVTWETDLLKGGYENYFMNMVTAEGFANAHADYVLQLGKEYLGKDPADLRVGIVGNTGFPSAMPSIVKARLEELGCAPVVYEIYDENLSDFTPIITKLKAAGCDIVIPSQFPPDADKFRKACKSLGYEPPVIFATGVAYDQPDFAQIGEAAEGCMSLCYTTPSMREDSSKGLKEFKEAFYEKTGHYPLTHALIAYSGLKTFFQAVENAGADDYESIRQAIYGLDIAPGDTPAYWGVKFNPENNLNERAGDPLVIGQWFEDGNGSYEFRVVYPKELATAEMVIPFGSQNQ
ncbi:MAG: ABC transporter substrate-binding protein [Clostridiales Family XIII bacterium]|nr:ABC transporter substrate-binding protein [Clostridiales Family XIII bacterium]